MLAVIERQLIAIEYAMDNAMTDIEWEFLVLHREAVLMEKFSFIKNGHLSSGTIH